jgi:hypothetical protein
LSPAKVERHRRILEDLSNRDTHLSLTINLEKHDRETMYAYFERIKKDLAEGKTVEDLHNSAYDCEVGTRALHYCQGKVGKPGIYAEAICVKAETKAQVFDGRTVYSKTWVITRLVNPYDETLSDAGTVESYVGNRLKMQRASGCRLHENSWECEQKYKQLVSTF